MNWPRALKTLGLLAFVGGGAWVLFSFYPTHRAFFPKCMLYEATGLYCPGCGSTRALRSLLCGDFYMAWRYNPLLTILLPFLLWWGYREYIFRRRGVILPRWLDTSKFAILITAVMMIYFVGRNLPWWPFCTWAPPQ